MNLELCENRTDLIYEIGMLFWGHKPLSWDILCMGYGFVLHTDYRHKET